MSKRKLQLTDFFQTVDRRIKLRKTKFLTGRQRVIFNFVRQRIYEGLPPSSGEIAMHFGFTQDNAWQILQALAKKGYVTWEIGKPRTITLLPPYKDDTRGSLILDRDMPQFNIRKGDFILIDTGKPVAKGEVFLSTQGQIKRFSTGDVAFGKVIGFSREID